MICFPDKYVYICSVLLWRIEKLHQYMTSSKCKLLPFYNSGKFQCPPTRNFRCRNNRVCLWSGKRCDGVDNCGDNSDETNCGESSALTCLSDFVRLSECLNDLCDMVHVYIGDHTSTCDKEQFKCSNGKCISANLRCNFFNDCEDYGSDEIGCKTGKILPSV